MYRAAKSYGKSDGKSTEGKVLDEFLHTALLYQAFNTGNINVLDALKQYLVLVKKEQWVTSECTVGFVSV